MFKRACERVSLGVSYNAVQCIRLELSMHHYNFQCDRRELLPLPQCIDLQRENYFDVKLFLLASLLPSFLQELQMHKQGRRDNFAACC